MAIRVHFPKLVPGRGLLGYAAALRVNGSDGAKVPSGAEETKYDQFNAEAPKLFEVADLDHAQVLIYPYCASTGPEIDEVAEMARRRNVGCIFISHGDKDAPVKVSYGTVYRHSMFANTRLPNEKAWTSEVCDPHIELRKPIPQRQWRDTPSVGFCGFVSNPFMRKIYQLSGRTEKAEGLILRAKLLRALRRTQGIQTQFITRQSYWAGARGRFKTTSQAKEAGPRKVFWDNVIDTDYTLCARGGGNFSYRFYEVLAAGRIPIFINTRCVLPFDDQIDWKKHVVWVEEEEINSVGEILKQFHARLTPEGFEQMQLQNRQLWENYLSPWAFFKKIVMDEVERYPQPAATNQTA
jgi:hypothetical protein